MAFRNSAKNATFTVVFNEVAQHLTMSMEARGLLLFMLSLPQDEFRKSWLEDKCPRWGRDKISKILKELETLGYLERTGKAASFKIFPQSSKKRVMIGL